MDTKPADPPSAVQDPPINAPPAAAGDEKRAGRAMLWKGLQLGTSKVLQLLGRLVLARLLTPADFGLVAIATVAITSVMTATDTGMTNALVQSTRQDREHYDVAWTIGLLRGSLVCALLCLTAPWVAQMFGDMRAAPLVRMMAFVPLLNSINSPRLAQLMRELRFSRLAIVAILAVVVELAFSVTAAASLGGAALILGKVLGAATIALTSYVVAPYRPRFRPSYASARQLIAFGRWLFAIGLTAVISDLLIKVLVSRRLSVKGLGVYFLADQLAETPLQTVNDSISVVAFPLYARLRSDPPRLQTAIRAHLVAIMFLLLPACALIAGLAQPLEHRILGDQWVGAAPLLTLLVIASACETTFNVCYHLLQALGQGGRLFAAELTQYIVLITGVGLLAGHFGLMGIGTARICTAVVVAFAGYIAAPPIFGAILRRTSLTGLALLLFSLLAGTIAWCGALIVPGVAGVAVGLAVGGGCYLLLVFLMDRFWQLGVREALALFFPMLGAKTGG